jgi:RimJ/RimL family protein N-acetyltransferase
MTQRHGVASSTRTVRADDEPASRAASESELLTRRLVPTDVDAYRPLMLEAYDAHPDAFTSSFAERSALPLAWWVSRLREDAGASEMVIGAFARDTLIGVAGLAFEPREKAKHKATLFGMYVPALHRRRRIGRRLVTDALAHAAARPGTRLVQLTVTDGNVAAEALYASCGFVRFGVEPFAVAVGSRFVAKVHMWRDLECPALR